MASGTTPAPIPEAGPGRCRVRRRERGAGARRLLPDLCFVAAAPLLVYCAQRVFFDTPNERTMGTAFKIFFFHVPMGWLIMIMAVICGIAAGFHLRRRSQRAGAVALAAALGHIALLSFA